MCVHLCMSMCMYVLVPEQARRQYMFPGIEITGHVNYPAWVLGMELRRAPSLILFTLF